MRRTLAAIGLGVTFLVLGPDRARAADLYRLLRDSATADRRHNYQGVKLLTSWKSGERSENTARVYHSAPNDTLMMVVEGDRLGAKVLQLGRQHYVQSTGRAFSRTPLPPPED